MDCEYCPTADDVHVYLIENTVVAELCPKCSALHSKDFKVVRLGEGSLLAELQSQSPQRSANLLA